MDLINMFDFGLEDLQLTTHELGLAWTLFDERFEDLTSPIPDFTIPDEEGLQHQPHSLNVPGFEAAPKYHPLIDHMYCKVDTEPQELVQERLAPVEEFKVSGNSETSENRDPPPAPTRTSQRRKNDSQQEEGVFYVKKPLNAFMLYRKEKRPHVVDALQNSDCALVNKTIGQMWRAMSPREQQKYHEEAEELRQLHMALHPRWSAKKNYGKKRKRIRKKVPASAEKEVS